MYDEERTPTRPVVQMPGGVSASNIHPHFAVADLIKAADELTTGEAVSVVATVTASAEIIATAPEPGADLLTQWAESMAVLAAALYFTATLSAEFVFKSDLLSKLEAHLVPAALHVLADAYSCREAGEAVAAAGRADEGPARPCTTAAASMRHAGARASKLVAQSSTP